MADLDEILHCSRPRRLFCDFDGTLAYIHGNPEDVVAVNGVVELLEQIATCWDVVAIVSGRAVSFLESHFSNPSLDLYGLYGLEERVAGIAGARVKDLAHWTKIVALAAGQISASAPVGVTVENKGLSMTTHFRNAPSELLWVLDASARAAKVNGLDLREARMSVELHPPVKIDKGTTVVEASPTVGATIFIGDDLGDLSAFRGLRELEAKGHLVLCVAVTSDEAPDELLAQADHVLEGPDGVLAFLEEISQAGS